MAAALIRLKVELRERHLQTHSAFCREYDKIAGTIDPALVGTFPGRTQFHRWLSGSLKGLPYPHHCRVLEGMFPGYTAEQLFERYTDELPLSHASAITVADSVTGLLDVIENRINQPTFGSVDWEPERPGDAPRSHTGLTAHDKWDVATPTRQLAQRLLQMEQTEYLDSREVSQFAYLAGHIIDLDTRIDIQISADGSAHLTYRYETLNMTGRPLTRMSRELWFKYTDGGLDIGPLRESTRRLAIQRIHDTPSLSKFACQLSPAIQPGESAVVGYTCDGGKFDDELYWRQTIARYTRHFSVHLRHENAGDLISCSATEEHPDGAENSATEDLIWDCDGDDAIVTLHREYLRPNQSVTLFWEVTREHS
ncbi:hypothetical protein [Nocardia sp. BMG51109]|uniref:hypothetical protein n=1 Tax=Nocardia sp. BMG51109 TaxID=1056816 RepID=UPI0004AE8938|nr:hypothetical protein [Nocardia sp. BMG51109]